MKTITQIQALLLACSISSPASAVDYQAFASVLHVEPVIETRHEQVTRRVCTGPDESARAFSNVASTIGDDIRHQTRLWQQLRRCRNVTEPRTRELISGYQVTYRYGGETETMRMSYDPGERMPVNVSLSPLP